MTGREVKFSEAISSMPFLHKTQDALYQPWGLGSLAGSVGGLLAASAVNICRQGICCQAPRTEHGCAGLLASTKQQEKKDSQAASIAAAHH